MLYKQTLNRAIVYCSPIRKFTPDISSNLMQKVIANTLPLSAIELLSQKILYFLDVQEWPDEDSPDLDYDGCKAYFNYHGHRYRLTYRMRGNNGYWYIFGTFVSTGQYKEIYIGSRLVKSKLIIAHERFQSSIS